jgi:AcrR family transcriptional regulator
MSGAAASTSSPRRRRRGPELLQAIHQAVLAELAEVGFGRLTMEGVAERAGCGKMPLYRRWVSTSELVLDTLTSALPAPGEPPDTGSLREDLLLVLTGMTEQIVATPVGAAIGSLIGEGTRHPEIVTALRERILEPRSQIPELLHRAATRGEIRPEAITPVLCRAGPAMILAHSLTTGTAPDEAERAAIVDELLLPALKHPGYNRE